MDKKKRWADYSDSECSYDDEDTTTISEPPELLETEESTEGQSLPYYVKIVNFPFKTTEAKIQDFLELDPDNFTHLKLLYSKGKQKKFRGIVIFTVTSNETGRRIRHIHHKPFEGRQLRFEVIKDWIDETPKKLPPTTLTGKEQLRKRRDWRIAHPEPTKQAKQIYAKH